MQFAASPEFEYIESCQDHSHHNGKAEAPVRIAKKLKIGHVGIVKTYGKHY